MMQSTLVDVAHEQVEVLRRGVSDIFVTMARRNRSLIDRQLAYARRVRSRGRRPRRAGELLPARPHGHPHAPQQRVAAGARQRRAEAPPASRRPRSTTSCAPRSARSRTTGGSRSRRSSTCRCAATSSPTSRTSWPSCSTTPSSFCPPDSRVTRRAAAAPASSYMICDRRRAASASAATASSELNELLARAPDRRSVGRADARHVGRVAARPQARRAGTARAVVPRPPGRGRAAGDSMYGPIDATGMLGVRAGVERPRSQWHPTALVDQTRSRTPATDTFVPDVVTVESPTASPSSRCSSPSPTFDVDLTLDGPTPCSTTPTRVRVRRRRRPSRLATDRGRRAARRRADVRTRVVDRAGLSRNVRAGSVESEIRCADAERRAMSPATELGAPASPPPQSHDRLSGEFDRPPAPPSFGTQPTVAPVHRSDSTADPAQAHRVRAPPATRPCRCRADHAAPDRTVDPTASPTSRFPPASPSGTLSRSPRPTRAR